MAPAREVYGFVGAAEWIRIGLECVGTLTIAIGALSAVVAVVRTIRRGVTPAFSSARLELSRYLVLALEFQLAADILQTSIAPDWTTIAQLAAIGAIRTALNYFLNREMQEERGRVAPVTASAPAG